VEHGKFEKNCPLGDQFRQNLSTLDKLRILITREPIVLK
jgi:hypothetical protein